MGDLHTGVRVACPAASAEFHVRAYIVQHASERGAESESAQFNLRLSSEALAGLGLAREDRGVHVVLRLIREHDGPYAHYKVRWTPERAGTQTLFFGELTLEADERGGETFSLRIDGRFESPRSEHVDAASDLSEKLANAIATELLRQIETFVLIAVESERSRGGRRTNGVVHEGYAG